MNIWPLSIIGGGVISNGYLEIRRYEVKIIDEKGRVFGKVNVIDLGVILLLIGIIPILYSGYKMLSMHKDGSEMRVLVEVKSSDVIPETVNVIKEGDVEVGPIGIKVGKIKQILSIKPADVMVTLDNKTVIFSSHPSNKDISVTLDMVCMKRYGVLFYNDKPVKIGSPITFTTALYDLAGTVTGFKENR